MNGLLEKLDLQRLMTDFVTFIPQLLVAVAVWMAFWMLYRVSRAPLASLVRRAGLHDKVVELLVFTVYRYTLLIFGLVMSLDQLGVNIGAALAGLGVAGIAIGFAAQDSLANLISGFLILIDKPFVVGDWITTEGEYGCVSEITLRTTRIRTPRNSFVVIPNKNIIDAVLENHSKNGELRVDVDVGIAYKEDIDEARRVLMEAITGLDGVRQSPEPEVVMKALGASSVDLAIRVWIDDASTERRASFQVVEVAKKALDAAGIEIPFPHLQLFVDEVKKPVWDEFSRVQEKARRAG